MNRKAALSVMFHAQDAAKAAESADKMLTSSLLGLIGVVASVTGNDDIDLSDNHVFVDPRTCNAEDDIIDRIGENDEGELVVFVNGDEEYELGFDDLILETRLQLVMILSQRLTEF